ncbi:type II toxin-antitoxin system death-on-curing family toxin [Cytobacillus depressus]|uniref:Type II toxin-antitoxin system death-on-curing family toxin n=1 Tax=Cytobacillus depressus TaxID=1602942 RepID=A0A6L3UY87_9BACI|nr:type II toxin-antitoxin system death-on-curing family toxin [Cytobacillus depressus]
MRYLTGREIQIIHYTIMKRHNDMDQAGIKFQDRFEAMLERPKIEMYGEEMFPSTELKACCYYHSIAKRHIFHNGNKRTALATFITFLRLNGLNLLMTNEDAESFTVYLAEHEKFKSNDAIEYLYEEIKEFIV